MFVSFSSPRKTDGLRAPVLPEHSIFVPTSAAHGVARRGLSRGKFSPFESRAKAQPDTRGAAVPIDVANQR